MGNPYQVVRDFEQAVCDFTGAKYCVAVNSCTMALFLAVKWHTQGKPTCNVEIPKRTYVSVPMVIKHAGQEVSFRDEDWSGAYMLEPLPVWDSARRFRRDMMVDALAWDTFSCVPGPGYQKHTVCVSFHASKPLGDTQGGAILHSNDEADWWYRRARFDGRREGVAPKDDNIKFLGWHCYMSPDVAARLTLKLHSLPGDLPDMPNDEYPDLSQMEVFK